MISFSFLEFLCTRSTMVQMVESICVVFFQVDQALQMWKKWNLFTMVLLSNSLCSIMIMMIMKEFLSKIGEIFTIYCFLFIQIKIIGCLKILQWNLNWFHCIRKFTWKTKTICSILRTAMSKKDILMANSSLENPLYYYMNIHNYLSYFMLMKKSLQECSKNNKLHLSSYSMQEIFE